MSGKEQRSLPGPRADFSPQTNGFVIRGAEKTAAQYLTHRSVLITVWVSNDNGYRHARSFAPPVLVLHLLPQAELQCPASLGQAPKF